MIRVIPLGGLGEVGMNAMVIESGDERILIDCGVQFGRADQPGVDVAVPDFSWLLEEPYKLKAIIATHAHEDHIGALPWLMRDFGSVPIYGAPFTLALIEHKLREAMIDADLRTFDPRVPFQASDNFSIEPVRVTHSVPDAVGLVMRTRGTTIVHTGDFKIDETPIDGEKTDLARLEEIGEEGVELLLSDSTNSEVAGHTHSEALVRTTFARLFADAPGRIIVAMFGSHLHRVRHSIEAAHAMGRRVVIVGRSMERNVELARNVSRLEIPDGVLATFDDLKELEPSKTLILCTGAQAEPRAGLSSLLESTDDAFRITARDTVILSSRTIPGNEQQVNLLLNRLLATGARVFSSHNEKHVHVSGHAAQDEQRQMISLVKPKLFVPIHGELRHLLRHHDTAIASGIAEGRSRVLTNGDALTLGPNTGVTPSAVSVHKRLYRREGMLPIHEASIAERRAVADYGVVICSVVLGAHGTLLAGPFTSALGFQGDEAAAISLSADGANAEFELLTSTERLDDAQVRECLQRGVRRVVKQMLGVKPLVHPVVVRMKNA